MTNEPPIDRLLARGGLSGREREEVLGRLLAQHAPAVQRRRAVATVAAAVLGIAACIAVGWFVSARRRGPATEFASRSTGAWGAHVEVTCSNGTPNECPRGSHLIFAVPGSSRRGYLAAYAEPTAGGERIWYFSNEQGAPSVPAGSNPGVPIDRAIAVGPEHAIGSYVVHLLLATAPLSRAEALHPDASSLLDAETFELRIVP